MKNKNRIPLNLLFAIGFVLILTASCEKDVTTITYGTMTDIDGNTYKTVTIGNQTWMAENLKVTKYNDGTAIPNVTDNTEWSNLSTGAQYYFGNDEYLSTYGRVYNWYAINTDKLCPTGWHVPSDAEWTELTNYLGGLTNAGCKLKETGTTHWRSPNDGATNEFGFTALPGGCRQVDGTFSNIGTVGGWWSSTEDGTKNAWSRFMSDNFRGIGQDYSIKQTGFSVRCVKD